MKKIRRNISISEEADSFLDEQPNASQFIEDLILGKGASAPWLDLEFRIDEMRAEILARLEKPVAQTPESEWKGDTDEIPACCKQVKKCKHWEFNDLEGTWFNSNSGETKDALFA